MKLGEKILKLRKNCKLSQEQLAERVNVTRQTISNWELSETSPNPEQLKLLSKELNVSIDELLDNDIKNVLEEKISNTEKLAGMVIKILKVLGVLFIVFLVIDIVSLILFTSSKREVTVSKIDNVEMSCSLNDDYVINVGSDGYFNCSNCSKELQKELRDNYIDFSDIVQTEKNIKKYFNSHNGMCE